MIRTEAKTIDGLNWWFEVEPGKNILDFSDLDRFKNDPDTGTITVYEEGETNFNNYPILWVCEGRYTVSYYECGLWWLEEDFETLKEAAEQYKELVSEHKNL